MTRRTKDILRELEQRMTRLEGILNSQSTRGDSKEGLYGIQDIRKFQVFPGRNLEANEKPLSYP